jgi:hypothetical protein
MAIGWNLGDGHMHNEQLIHAMQQRCRFEPGEVRARSTPSRYTGSQAYRPVGVPPPASSRRLRPSPTWSPASPGTTTYGARDQRHVVGPLRPSIQIEILLEICSDRGLNAAMGLLTERLVGPAGMPPEAAC